MKPTLNEKFIAYLALLSGLSISAVAVYYSVVGLTAIFAAAVIPIIIMGTTLEISKLVATVWLKQNWKTAPLLIKTYLFTAIVVLMIITSLGIFGFLSKAHSDQNLVSGDVTSKIAIYDEKIKTEKENIEANRKALKQMDAGVDQVLGRSTDEKGADKAVALRRTQQKERVRLQDEISQSQKSIAELNEARAPIAAEVRKVEAEVGPIKYIAAFFYGSTDQTILEKSVTWVIITIIIVFDPLAIILLLASQISFQEFRERENKIAEGDSPRETTDVIDTEPPTVTELAEDIIPTTIIPEPISGIPIPGYEPEYVKWPGGQSPLFCNKCGNELVDAPGIGLVCPNLECGVIKELNEHILEPVVEGYVQNEEQKESGVWTSTITQSEYAEISEERKKEMIVSQWADRLRNKDVSEHHVPVDILEAVKAKL
jgi:hypothetical protein